MRCLSRGITLIQVVKLGPPGSVRCSCHLVHPAILITFVLEMPVKERHKNQEGKQASLTADDGDAARVSVQGADHGHGTAGTVQIEQPMR